MVASRNHLLLLFFSLLALLLIPAAEGLVYIIDGGSKEGQAGETVEFRVTVKNVDDGRIQVRLKITDYDAGLVVESPREEPWLNNGDQHTFVVKIEILRDTKPGDYYTQSKAQTRRDYQDEYQDDGSSKFERFHVKVVDKSGTSASSAIATAAVGITIGAAALIFLEKKYYFLSGLGLLPLHWRLESDEVLENEVRSKVFELVRSSEGVSLSQMVKGTGLSKSTVRYALRVLLAFNYIVQGPNRYYYLPGKNISHLTNTQAEIIGRLDTQEMFRQEELARAVGLTRAGLVHQMDILIKRGDIERVKKGRYVYYRPNTKMDRPDHWWETSTE